MKHLKLELHYFIHSIAKAGKRQGFGEFFEGFMCNMLCVLFCDKYFVTLDKCIYAQREKAPSVSLGPIIQQRISKHTFGDTLKGISVCTHCNNTISIYLGAISRLFFNIKSRFVPDIFIHQVSGCIKPKLYMSFKHFAYITFFLLNQFFFSISFKVVN